MADHLPGYSEWEEIYYWGFGEEETRDTNVIMEKAAEKSAVELEKIPSISSVLEEIPLYSSNMKIIVEDSGPGGCSSRLNNSPRKHQRRRKKELPKEGFEPAIGTSGISFSNPEVNTKSSEIQNLPHHFPDQPTLDCVGYLAVSETQEDNPNELEQWLKQMKQEKWWPQDQHLPVQTKAQQETKGN